MHKQHKNCNIIAHNFKGFDGYFLLNYLISQSIRPDHIIYAGSKIMSMKIGRGLNMRFIDSLNFFPAKLADLPKMFGFSELKKVWFPHLFNTCENVGFSSTLISCS